MAKKATSTSEDKAGLVLSVLKDKKAVEPVVLDVRDRTLMTDFFVIASGTSGIHIKAVVDAVIEKLTEDGAKRKRLAGCEEAAWVLLDYGSVVVHIFAPQQREVYDLESYWTGAEKGSPPLLADHPLRE